MQKIQVPIKGMHCKSCEILVEDSLKEIKGVKKTEVSHKKHNATIYYEGDKPDLKKIETAVREAGYEIGQEEKSPWFSRSINDYKDLGIAAVFLGVAYFILKGTGLTNMSLGSIANPSGLPVVLLVGLTAGVSSCMALVGGLILGISARHAESHPESTIMEKFRPHIFFNLGRIVGYAILGGILGLVGSAFQLSGFTNGVLVIIVGVFMFILGLQLLDIFPKLKNFSLSMPKSISRILGIKDHAREYNHRNTFILGALTFFLPCGFTQAMQVYALSSGNFLSGAAIMGTFALGTLPGLISVGGLTSFVKGIFAKKFFKFAGLALIFMALFNLNNGLNLAGWQIDWSLPTGRQATQSSAITSLSDPNVKMENGVQVVNMEENEFGYQPNKFTIVKGVPVKWVINAKEPYSCASSLVMSGMGISKHLQAGENVIEFTPTDTGRLAFSCSMGMYTGAFNVVN